MDKQTFIERVANRLGVSLNKAREAVDGVIEETAEVLAEGETLDFRHFGSFTLKSRPDRTGRNPRTGEAIKIAASKSVQFKPHTALRTAVNR